jgi:uncharacterized protein YidB (DUF937 family)
MDLESLKQDALAAASKYAGEHPQIGQEVANLVHAGPGGLSGLVQQFHSAGFAAVVQSWVSTGPNQPITAQQIQQVLGNEKVKQIAARLGVDTNVVSQKLATILPEVVNHLTPNGQVPVPAADIKA